MAIDSIDTPSPMAEAVPARGPSFRLLAIAALLLLLVGVIGGGWAVNRWLTGDATAPAAKAIDTQAVGDLTDPALPANREWGRSILKRAQTTTRGQSVVDVSGVASVGAIERIVAGLEKRNRVLNPREREIVAYHELGHALVALALPGTDTVHKVSIIPRGIGALGYTIQRPTEDRFLMTARELEDKIAVLLGGRAAEDVMIGEITTGASDDLRRVTSMARRMVSQFGMSEAIGPLNFGEDERQPFLGYSLSQGRNYSEQTAAAIDTEVRRIVDDMYSRTRVVVSENRDKLEALTQELLKTEIVNRSRVLELMGLEPSTDSPADLFEREFSVNGDVVTAGEGNKDEVASS